MKLTFAVAVLLQSCSATNYYSHDIQSLVDLNGPQEGGNHATSNGSRAGNGQTQGGHPQDGSQGQGNGAKSGPNSNNATNRPAFFQHRHRVSQDGPADGSAPAETPAPVETPAPANSPVPADTPVSADAPVSADGSAPPNAPADGSASPDAPVSADTTTPADAQGPADANPTPASENGTRISHRKKTAETAAVKTMKMPVRRRKFAKAAAVKTMTIGGASSAAPVKYRQAKQKVITRRIKPEPTQDEIGNKIVELLQKFSSKSEDRIAFLEAVLEKEDQDAENQGGSEDPQGSDEADKREAAQPDKEAQDNQENLFQRYHYYNGMY